MGARFDRRRDARALWIAAALVCVGLVACFNPHPPRGAPCNDDSPCPVSQRCIDRICGGVEPGTPDAGPGEDAAVPPGEASVPIVDLDRDTVDDSHDNCVGLANPDQGNEDGDALGDACDPCPIDTSSADPDSDGVAGACDPHPTTAGDRIVAFTGFHRGVPAGWGFIGTATQDGDSLSMTPGAMRYTSVVPEMDPIGNGTITAELTVDSAAGPEGAAMDISLPYDPIDDGIFCELDVPDTTKSTGHYITLWDSLEENADGGVERAVNNFAWAFGTAYRMTMTRTQTNYVCSVGPAGGGGTPQLANGSSPNTPVVSKATVASYGANAHVQWMMVVSSP